MIQIRKSLLLLTIGVILLSGCTVPDAPVPAVTPSITPTPTPASTPTPAPGETPQEVTFDQLLADPVQYNGRLVVLEGFYFSGWEVVVLVGKLHYTGYAPKWVAPEGRMVWIERVPGELVDKLYQQQVPGLLKTERYGKVRIAGKFEYGGKYGHVGAYSSQIVTLKAELLPWSPPMGTVSPTSTGPVTLW